MKARTFLMFPLLILSLTAICQDKLTDKDGPAWKCKSGDFTLDTLKEKVLFPFPAETIEVSDIRQDTTKFGYFHSASFGATLKFSFKKNAAAEITHFLNSAVTHTPAPEGQEIVYCLKKLWIVSADTTNRDLPRPFVTRSKLYLKAELYMKKDSCYYPLYRFDSVFVYDKPITSFSIKWVAESLLKSLNPLKDLAPEKVAKRPYTHLSDMNSYYADEKQLPVISTATPQKGVYLNAEQFKNNQPAYTDFEVVFDDLVDEMKIKDKQGNTTILTKDWGFCDGNQFFMRMGSNYFRLFKMGYTFDLYGTSRLDMQTRYRSQAIPAGGMSPATALFTVVLAEALKKDKSRLGKLKPLQLDMETGSVY
ncbi:MAG TPA: hypothetical protein VGM41_20600 [Chitinophagaceae bacterium]|jgi:hypothetical protein